MNKQEFIDYYKRKITLGAFNEPDFYHESVEIIRKTVSTNTIGGFYTPWYYVDDQEVNYGEALQNKMARSMTISEVYKRSADQKRNNTIKEYESSSSQATLVPFPVATNTIDGRTLILDGNKTLTALFNNKNDSRIELVVLLMKAEVCEKVVGDFNIINRGGLHPLSHHFGPK